MAKKRKPTIDKTVCVRCCGEMVIRDGTRVCLDCKQLPARQLDGGTYGRESRNARQHDDYYRGCRDDA